MFKGKLPLSWALIPLVLCLGLSIVEGQILAFDNCPVDITETRSELVYWTPPVVSSGSNVEFTVVGTHQPGRYYYQTTTVTYTAKGGGLTETCTFDITITDNGSPVITSCPSDMTAMAPVGQTEVSVSFADPVVQDAANTQVTSDKSSGDLFSLGRNTVTFTIRATNNASAPMSFCSFDIFVEESTSTTVPTLLCPDHQSVKLALGQKSVPISWDDPVYPDNLGSVTVTCGRKKNDNFYKGRNEITCVAYFESGDARMCSFTVTVTPTEDTQNPSIVDCPSDIVEYVAPNATGKEVTWPEPTITDNNQLDLQLTASHTNGIFYNVGTYTITYTGSDVANNEVMCTFTLTVENDDVPPVIEGCLSPTSLRYVQAGQTSGTVSWPEPTATDNADQNVQLDGPTGNLQNGGTMNVGETRSVSYVATDDFGNSQNCDFTVRLLVDLVPQYSGCSVDTTVPAESGVSYANVTWPEPLVTDDRSQDNLILTKSYEPGRNFEIGDYIVEYTATDEIGNVGICSFALTIADQQKPMLGPCPNSSAIALDESELGIEFTWTNPTATDNSCAARSNCNAELTITSDVSPGLFAEGFYNVTITATDGSMNTDSCYFTITVSPYVPDTENPMWTGCPSSITGYTDSGEPTYTYSWTVPTVSDNRGIVYQFESHESPFAFPIGSTTVTYRAEDAAGNPGVCSFTVTVEDDKPPVWDTDSICNSSIVHYVLSSRTTNLPLAMPTPTATDNSRVAPVITNSLTSQSVVTYPFNIGSNVIQFTATDGSGNANMGMCQVSLNILRDSNPWSIRGSVTLTHIRGVTGQFADATTTTLLNELAGDMDTLFRSSSIGSHFVGVQNLTHTFVSGNTRVSFQLYFSKLSPGRHTSRQIREAFYGALPSSLTFATNNFVVANSLDFHVREFKLTSTIIQLDATVNPPFTILYDNPMSSTYMVLENRINTAMDSTFGVNFFRYAVSVVVDFRDGSIINDNVLVFDDISATSEAGIVNKFNGELEADGQLMSTGLYFNQVPEASNQELCPDGECENGGTCSVDTTYTNVCTCPSGFSGTRCETEDPTVVLSPLALAAIIGGGILLLLLLFAACCCCLYLCRQPEKYYYSRPIIEDDVSAASSMEVIMMPRPRPLPPPAPVLALPAPPPPAPVLALPPVLDDEPLLIRQPPPPAPTLRLNDDYLDDDVLYGRRNEAFVMDMYPSDGPSFTPDGEVYVTGPNQVAIRPRSKRSGYYRY